MSEPVATGRPLSVEEYLEREKSAEVRHEYVGGYIYALAGASRRRNRISGNIYRRLADAAEGGPCRVYMSDVKLRAAEDIVYYPDVMVACGDEPEDPYVEHEPCLVVEVVSPNTEGPDRREKLIAYRSIPSVRAYLMVDQDLRRVEHHWRDEDGTWRRAGRTEEGEFSLPYPPGAELPLAEIYEGL